MDKLDRALEKNNVVLLLSGELHDKIYAHRNGYKHYACSVIIFNRKKEILLQKRSNKKYHFGGLWTNSCCTHPLSQNESIIKETAEKRLIQEMNIECDLKFVCAFSYYAESENKLKENEYDYVYIGCSDDIPLIDLNEADDYKWMQLEEVRKDVKLNEILYTPWFCILINRYMKLIESEINKEL